MSTSLNVVSIAAVFCASLRRFAIGLAQARHADALFLAAGSRRRPAGRAAVCGRLSPRRARARGGCGLGGGGEHVVLGQAAVLAGALDGRRIDAVLEHRAAHRRRQRLRAIPSPAGARAARRGAGAARRRERRCGGYDPRLGGARAASAPPASIVAITAPTATVSPSLTTLLAHHAGDRRRHFDRDLVGLEAGDRLVAASPHRRAS
jgi:hypothetical protein